LVNWYFYPVDFPPLVMVKMIYLRGIVFLAVIPSIFEERGWGKVDKSRPKWIKGQLI